MKTEIIPVVIGAFGVIKKGSGKSISEIPGNINFQEIQKTTLLGMAHLSSDKCPRFMVWKKLSIYCTSKRSDCLEVSLKTV